MSTKLRSIFIWFEPPDRLKSKFVEPRYLVDYLWFVLCPFKSERIRGIRIFYTNCNETLDHEDSLVCKRMFDFYSYVSMTREKRDAYLLDHIRNDLCELGEKFNWDVDAVEDAVVTVSGSNYFFRGVWGKPKKSPSRKRRAEVWIDYENEMKIYFRVHENSQIVANELISIAESGFALAKSICKEIKWNSEDQVRVYHENHRDYWEYGFLTQDIKYVYSRPGSEDGHGEFILGKMYLDGYVVLKNEMRGTELIRTAANKGYKHAIKMLPNLTSYRSSVVSSVDSISGMNCD